MLIVSSSETERGEWFVHCSTRDSADASSGVDGHEQLDHVRLGSASWWRWRQWLCAGTWRRKHRPVPRTSLDLVNSGLVLVEPFLSGPCSCGCWGHWLSALNNPQLQGSPASWLEGGGGVRRHRRVYKHEIEENKLPQTRRCTRHFVCCHSAYKKPSCL